MTPAEVLERAADYMAKHGKCEVVYEHRSSVCVLGAIGKILGANLHDREESRALWLHPATQALRGIAGNPCIPQWSDSRSEAEVIAGLLACAATLRAQEWATGIVTQPTGPTCQISPART